MKFKQNKSGIEMIPNVDFWIGLPDNTKVLFLRYDLIFIDKFNLNFENILDWC